MQLMAERGPRVSRRVRASAGSPARSCAIDARAIRRSRSRIWAGTSCSSRAAHPVLAGHRRRRRMPISSTAIICAWPIPPICSPTTDYGGPIAAVVGRDNMVGTQFHPGKEPGDGAAADRQFPAVAAMNAQRRIAGHDLGRAADQAIAGTDLDDLCEATEAAIATAAASAGSSRRRARCWRIIGRACCWCPSAASSSAGSTASSPARPSSSRPPRNNEAQAFAGTAHQRLRRALGARPRPRPRLVIERSRMRARARARRSSISIVRETQRPRSGSTRPWAITRWGTHPGYARVDGKRRSGHYYFKRLDEPALRR